MSDARERLEAAQAIIGRAMGELGRKVVDEEVAERAVLDALGERPVATMAEIERLELLSKWTTNISLGKGESERLQADLRTVLDALSELEAKEAAREEQGRREWEYYRETTCPCTAAERYVSTCPKHGTPLLERGRNTK